MFSFEVTCNTLSREFKLDSFLYHFYLLELSCIHNPQAAIYFLQKIAKIGCNKNAKFFTDISFAFLNNIVITKYLWSHNFSGAIIVTKGVAVKKSNHQQE